MTVEYILVLVKWGGECAMRYMRYNYMHEYERKNICCLQAEGN